MKRTLIHIFILVICFTGLRAQNGITGNPDWQVKAAINQGFIVAQHLSIGHLIKGYPTIYEVDISKPSLGNKLWQIENNKPDMGITMQCLDFKNPAQLGYALTIAPFIEIPLNKTKKASRLILRLCWGATYITRCFNIETDPKNIVIGSHVNAYVQFKWFWHLQLTKNLRFEPGFAFTHASNGKSQNPNLGLNVLSLNAAFNYLLPSAKRPQVTKIDSSTRVRSKNELMLVAAYGFNEHSVATPLLNCFVLSAAYQRNVRNTHKFSAGLDFFYDQNYFVDYKNMLLTDATGFNKLRISTRLGYSYNIGRISFPLELGYYVFEKIKPDASMVARIGVRYYARNGLIGHFGLRTHFAVAYNFEFGLGYRYFI